MSATKQQGTLPQIPLRNHFFSCALDGILRSAERDGQISLAIMIAYLISSVLFVPRRHCGLWNMCRVAVARRVAPTREQRDRSSALMLSCALAAKSQAQKSIILIEINREEIVSSDFKRTSSVSEQKTAKKRSILHGSVNDRLWAEIHHRLFARSSDAVRSMTVRLVV